MNFILYELSTIIMVMPPENPSPDYNFIMSGGRPVKKSALGGLLPRGTSTLQRVLIFIIIAGVLITIAALVFSFIFGGKTSNTDKLVGIAAQQTELARVAAIGEKEAVGVDAKNLASTVSLSLISGQQQLLEVIKAQGHKIKPQELSAAKDEKTDQQLTAAGQSNRFDETFTEVMQAGLSNYQKDLNEAYNASSSKTEKQALENLYNQVKLLTKTEE